MLCEVEHHNQGPGRAEMELTVVTHGQESRRLRREVVQGQPGINSESQASHNYRMRPSLKNEEEGKEEEAGGGRGKRRKRKKKGRKEGREERETECTKRTHSVLT